MNCLQGVKKKKGLFWLLPFVLIQKFQALFEKYHVHFFDVKIRSNHSRTVITGIRMLGQRSAVDDLSGRYRYAVVIDISVEPVSGWAGNRSEKMIETAIYGSAS